MFLRNDKFNQLNQIVLFYVDKEYRSRHIGSFTDGFNDGQSLLQALRIAETNGLLYLFCSRLIEEPCMKHERGLLQTKLTYEKNRLLLLKKTLSVIEELFEKEKLDFMLIKLYRGLPYSPRDVDVLVKPSDIQTAISLMRRNEFDVEIFSDVEIQCQRADLLKVDLYCGFYYLSLSFIDNDFLWKNPRIVDIQGLDFPIPSFEADFLSLVIHSLLSHRRFSLLDFLYAKSLLNSTQLDFYTMYKEAERNGWAHALIKVCHTFKDLHKSLYSSLDFPRGVSFPFVYSTKIVFEAFQGFSGLPIEIRKKILFVLSAFLDSMYHKYLGVGQVVPLEVPKQLRNMIAQSLYKVRKFRGDRKLSMIIT